jgi:hypothetical protein
MDWIATKYCMLQNINNGLGPAEVNLHVLLALVAVRKSVYYRIA